MSIVIPCYREVALVRACLASLRRDCCSVSREVIVLLNGTDQDGALDGDDLEGVTLIRSRVNRGFAAGCNLAARRATGEFLVFLNDDVQVGTGWLDELVRSAEEDPHTGAVGCRITRHDGTLQEAGSILWSDGTTLGVGVGSPADDARFAHRRSVDYCSACALLVRRTSWDALEGFDESFVMAYFEDVDLCLGIRALGQRVVYEPNAVVTHREHASTDETLRRLLFEVNVTRLGHKWGRLLAEQEDPDGLSAAAVRRAMLRAQGWPVRVLVIDDRVPNARLGSGDGRMLNIVGELAKAGHAVSLATTKPGQRDSVALGRLGVEMVTEALGAHLARPEIIYEAVVISRPDNLEASIDMVRRLQPMASVVYDAQALIHRRLEREAALASDPEQAAHAAREAEAFRLMELKIGTRVDAIVCVCEGEAELLRNAGATCPVHVMLPLDQTLALSAPGFSERRDILLTAGWLAGARSPNGDGLRWFATQVLPLVEARVPSVRVRVTGFGPPQELRPLAGPGLEFTEGVADLRSLYDRTRVVIVPIRYGSGVRIKAIEAMAQGIPVVGTSVGLEGIPHCGRAVDVADDPESFATAVVALLRDRDRWEQRHGMLKSLRRTWEETCCKQTWPDIISLVRERSLALSESSMMAA